MAERFRNWSESVEFAYERRARPKGEKHLRRLVADARARRLCVRPVGSGHSSTPLVQTRDTLVDFGRFTGLDSHDVTAMTASVGAGTTLEDLGGLLEDVGMAMENLGDVAYQTIAGAVGTGTHGTGLGLGNVSSTVVGGRLVTGTGDLVPFGVEAGTDGTDAMTRAAQVSLGSLGMFTSLTLRVLHAYDLHRRNVIAGTDWAIDEFDQLTRTSRHMDFYWYPRRDEVKLRFMDLPGHLDLIDVPMRERKANEIGPSHRIITNRRELRFDEMEYMFPLERGMEVFRAVRQRVIERHRQHVGWRVLVRTVAGDDAMLSNCNTGPTVTIALLQNSVLDHDDYFSDMEPMFLDFGGRPHWGKKHTRTASDLRRMYPEWDEFQRIRRRLDPDGVFMNDYLRTLFEEDA
ncbi:D-arabinono-1,4-lactone oxidase [Microbacterium sp. NPDC055910]|uniref:D-arabinono-1,4-lactone oxidase n=1 Tax=Microbacterium sp. NPDC055910 TaxID=3345659 RepID=UPI0035D5938B